MQKAKRHCTKPRIKRNLRNKNLKTYPDILQDSSKNRHQVVVSEFSNISNSNDNDDYSDILNRDVNLDTSRLDGLITEEKK